MPTTALPTPSTLPALGSIPGLPQDRIRRLPAIAEATMRGRLEVDRLRAMLPEEAKENLQQLPGFGPFYGALVVVVVVRALGLADVRSPEESRLREAIRSLDGLDHHPSDAEVAALAENWRPLRTWAMVMIPAIGGRLGAHRSSLTGCRRAMSYFGRAIG